MPLITDCQPDKSKSTFNDGSRGMVQVIASFANEKEIRRQIIPEGKQQEKKRLLKFFCFIL